MRLALGTIDLSDEERAAISCFYGERADRATCRRYIIANGIESLDAQIATMTDEDWKRWLPK